MEEHSAASDTYFPGFRFPRLSVGPLSDAMVLRLATLVGDFHPWCLLEPTAQAPGRSGRTAHHLWVALLVDAGVGQLGPGVRVLRVSVEYHSDAATHERLSLDMTVESSQGGDGTVVVSFEVTASGGTRIATGGALVTLREIARKEIRE